MNDTLFYETFFDNNQNFEYQVSMNRFKLINFLN
jgi:hypothetical protein